MTHVNAVDAVAYGIFHIAEDGLPNAVVGGHYVAIEEKKAEPGGKESAEPYVPSVVVAEGTLCPRQGAFPLASLSIGASLFWGVGGGETAGFVGHTKKKCELSV